MKSKTFRKALPTMKKVMIMAMAALIAGAIALSGQAIASHTDTDLYVNDDVAISDGSSCASPDFNSIQAAINHANSGDTVLVCPGTYPEHLIINQPLTVKSTDGPAVTTVGATLYLVWIRSSDVTLEGFTITDPNNMAWADNSAIICTGAGNLSNVKILNNIIEAPASPSRLRADFGTFGINCITGGTLTNIEIAHNIIRDIHAPLYWSNGTTFGGVSIGIFLYSDPSSSGIDIHDNEIYNIASTRGPAFARAITISVNVSDVSITCNDIFDNGIGIRVTSTATGVRVHYNNIYNNTVAGLQNNTSSPVDAENNWWGHTSGPSGLGTGSGDAVINPGGGSVDFDPWLTSPQDKPCPPPAVIEVEIDIKPGSFPNPINPRSRGQIPVAILTTDTFDATTVDSTTVRFGKTGTEAASVQSALEDVDGDGDADMILHFNTQETGIQCGNTSATLTGETFGGQMIEGSDLVKTVGCK